MNVAPEHHLRPPRSPSTGAHVAIALGDSPRGRHQQPKGEVGGGLGQDARRVADRDAGASRGGEVDIVDAHGQVADRAKPRQRADSGGVETIGDHAEHAVGLPRARPQLSRRRRHLVVPQIHPRRRCEPADCGLRDRPRNEDPALAGARAAVLYLPATMLHPVAVPIASWLRRGRVSNRWARLL